MRAARRLSATLCLAFAAAAFAGAEEDHRAGFEAYQRGDVRNAISMLRKPADEGHGPSQALLGHILDLAEENEQAAKYLRMAADQGVADGVFGLAVLYASGEGVSRDLDEARRLMTRAAGLGHRQAVQAVALAYVKGGLGLTEADRGSAEALPWIERAVAMDSLPAIDRLAVAYRLGQMGLAADEKKAAELEARARALRKLPPPKGTRKPAKANG